MSEQPSESWMRYRAKLPERLARLHDDPPADVLPLPGGRQVTVTELCEVLREQVSGMTAGVRELREDRKGPGLPAAAWRHTVYRQARAVLLLLDARLAVEAQANARVCLEHAVLLQRVAHAADADQLDPLLEELVHQQQLRQNKQLDYLGKIDTHAGGEHGDLLAATRKHHGANRVPADKNRPQARTAKSHFDDVPSGEHWHSVYGRLSESVHAGLGSAAPYLLPALKHDTPVPAQPGPVAWAETLAVLCWSCWAADDAMRRFLVDGDDLSARHEHLMARIGLASGS